MNTTAKRTLGVLGATAVGAVAGILFAPAVVFSDFPVMIFSAGFSTALGVSTIS